MVRALVTRIIHMHRSFVTIVCACWLVVVRVHIIPFTRAIVRTQYTLYGGRYTVDAIRWTAARHTDGSPISIWVPSHDICTLFAPLLSAPLRSSPRYSSPRYSSPLPPPSFSPLPLLSSSPSPSPACRAMISAIIGGALCALCIECSPDRMRLNAFANPRPFFFSGFG